MATLAEDTADTSSPGPDAEAPKPPRLPRLLILVDGVYFQTAMQAAGMYYHIDFPRLARALAPKIEHGCTLVKLKFFLAPSSNRRTNDRERALFAALEGSASTELVLGWHERQACKKCGSYYYREKGTDVSVATALIDGAHRDQYDTALLVTGDEDYESAMNAARSVSVAQPVNPHLAKRVIWGHFGTQATNGKLAGASDGTFLLEDKILRTVQRINVQSYARGYRGR